MCHFSELELRKYKKMTIIFSLKSNVSAHV